MNMHVRPVRMELDEATLARVHAEVGRLKREFNFAGEVVYLETMAAIMGIDVRAVWNLRSRGRMPAIPEVEIGAKPGYFTLDVAMWMLRLAYASSAESTVGGVNQEKAPFPKSMVMPPLESQSGMTPKSGKPPRANAKASGGWSPEARKSLLDRANRMFEESERKRTGK
jgi:hypothetical protein